jgi:hypothetical protein
MKAPPLLAALLPVAIGACATARHPQLDSIPRAQKRDIPTTQASCNAVKGHWSQQGLGGGPFVCDLQANDALKICTDSSQCEGSCLISKSIQVGQKQAIGSCSNFLRNYGCYKFIESGRVRSICSD